MHKLFLSYENVYSAIPRESTVSCPWGKNGIVNFPYLCIEVGGFLIN